MGHNQTHVKESSLQVLPTPLEGKALHTQDTYLSRVIEGIEHKRWNYLLWVLCRSGHMFRSCHPFMLSFLANRVVAHSGHKPTLAPLHVHSHHSSWLQGWARCCPRKSRAYPSHPQDSLHQHFCSGASVGQIVLVSSAVKERKLCYTLTSKCHHQNVPKLQTLGGLTIVCAVV